MFTLNNHAVHEDYYEHISTSLLFYFSLNFTFNPSSRVFKYELVELKPSGEDEEVTLDNLEEYIELITDFCLNTGIHRQMEALRGTVYHIRYPLIEFPEI